MRRGMRWDALNKTLLIAGAVLFFIFRSVTGYVLAGACITLFLVRSFSSDLYARERENQRFLDFFANLRARFSSRRAQRVRPVRPVYRGEANAGQQARNAQREEKKNFKVYKCPECKQELRVPRGKGKILITCSNCGNKFEKKT